MIAMHIRQLHFHSSLIRPVTRLTGDDAGQYLHTQCLSVSPCRYNEVIMSQHTALSPGRTGSSAQPITETRPEEMRRVIFAAMAGSFVEWFEFSVYGYLALVMGNVFFAGGSDSTRVIAAFAAFAVAFIARPFGGLIFGLIGDKFGRKRALNLALMLMAVATFCIGLIPSYQSIGITAPILLVAMRLLQGLSSGGEISGASIFVAECSPDAKRTLHTSWIEVGSMGGFIFGALLSALLYRAFGTETVTDWAWRIPFLLAAPLALIGVYIRYKINESPEFIARKEQVIHAEAQPFREMMRYRKAMLKSGGLLIGSNIPIFIIMTYMPTWLVTTLKLSANQGLMMGILPMCLLLITIPLFALLADRTSRKGVMLAGNLGLVVLSVPCFNMLQSGQLPLQLGGLIILSLCLSMVLSCILSKVPSLFPVQVRFSCMAISYNIAVALFAGTAPMLNAWLISITGNPSVPAYYLMVGALIGSIATFVTRDRTGQPLRRA